MRIQRGLWGLGAVALWVSGAGFAQQPKQSAKEREPYKMPGVIPAPKLVGEKEDWANTNGKTLAFERGKVYVVEFWTFGCINCLRNLPAYNAWHKQFQKQGAVLIGVHTPETEQEKVRENVFAKIKSLKIDYPVLLDMQAENWRRWQQQMWPTVYLIDKRGNVRYGWMGELEWEGAQGTVKMTEKIKALLAEKPPAEETRENNRKRE